MDFIVPDTHWNLLKINHPMLYEWLQMNYPKERHFFLVKNQSGSEFTCVYKNASQTKYLYSRYTPRKIDIKANSDRVILLGVGIGYELEALYSPERTILVFETNPEMWLIFIGMESNRKFIADSHVKFFFQEESDIDFGYDWEILESANVRIEKEVQYREVYSKFIGNSQKSILIYDYPVFARNLCNAFKELGYNCHLVTWDGEVKARSTWSRLRPRLIIAINHNHAIQSLANLFGITYISWTIDSPSFNIMDKSIVHPRTVHFCYDRSLVSHLSTLGVSNIEYLPPATVARNFNSEMDGVIDVSFVGNVVYDENLWNTYKDKLPSSLFTYILEIVGELSECDLSLASWRVFDSLQYEGVHLFDKIWEYIHSVFVPMDYLTYRERIALHLTKEISRRFRIKVVNRLIKKFGHRLNVHVYGNEAWKDVLENPAPYKGYLDEMSMAQVFYTSKINLNLIQPQAGDAALPMRVYDVLGSRGFLISNDRPSLHAEFTPSVHLITTVIDRLGEAIEYYLQNPKERQMIRDAGWEKIKKSDTFNNRAGYIIERLKINNLI